MKRKNWNFWLFFTCFRFQKKEAEISRLKIEFDKFHEEKELEFLVIFYLFSFLEKRN